MMPVKSVFFDAGGKGWILEEEGLFINGYLVLEIKDLSELSSWINAEMAKLGHGKHSAKADEDGWVKWRGGYCPVTHETKIKVRFRSGVISGPEKAGFLRWSHNGGRGDIVDYRVIKETDNVGN